MKIMIINYHHKDIFINLYNSKTFKRISSKCSIVLTIHNSAEFNYYTELCNSLSLNIKEIKY